jgi:hypothetical protein
VPSPEISQRWLDRFVADFPAAEHMAIGFDGQDGAVGDLDWFATHGFDVEASTVMTPPRSGRQCTPTETPCTVASARTRTGGRASRCECAAAIVRPTRVIAPTR